MFSCCCLISPLCRIRPSWIAGLAKNKRPCIHGLVYYALSIILLYSVRLCRQVRLTGILAFLKDALNLLYFIECFSIRCKTALSSLFDITLSGLCPHPFSFGFQFLLLLTFFVVLLRQDSDSGILKKLGLRLWP